MGVVLQFAEVRHDLTEGPFNLPVNRIARARVRLAEIQQQVAESLDRQTQRTQQLAEFDATQDAAQAKVEGLRAEVSDLPDALPAQIKAAEALLLADAGTPLEASARARVGELKSRLAYKTRALAEAEEKAHLLARVMAEQRATIEEEDAADAAVRTGHVEQIQQLEHLIAQTMEEAAQNRRDQLLGELKSLEEYARRARAEADVAEQAVMVAREAVPVVLSEEGYAALAASTQIALFPPPTSQAASIELLEAGQHFLTACQQHAGKVPALVLNRVAWSRVFDWGARFTGALAGLGGEFATAQADITSALDDLRAQEQQEVARRQAHDQ